MTEEDIKKLNEFKEVTLSHYKAQLFAAEQEVLKAEERLAQCKAIVEAYQKRIASYKG